MNKVWGSSKKSRQEVGLETRLHLHSSSSKEQVPRLCLNGAPGQWAGGGLVVVPSEGGRAIEASLLTGSWH